MNILGNAGGLEGLYIPNERVSGPYAASDKFAIGSKYGPLLAGKNNYMCPDCGGYGFVPSAKICAFCNGSGTISVSDSRIVDYDPRQLLKTDETRTNG